MKFSTYETTLIYFPLLSRAHHTHKKQGDLISPSENMREKWRHDRETSNSFIETCFCWSQGRAISADIGRETSPTSPGLVSPAPKGELCIWFVMCSGCRLRRGFRPHRSEKIGYNAILQGFPWGSLITCYSTIKIVVTSRRGHKCFVKLLYISNNIFFGKVLLSSPM